MTKLNRSNERGFTLTELLVALTVTVIGLAGLLSLHVTTIKGNSTAARAGEAVIAAELAAEDVRRLTVRAFETANAVITGTEQTVNLGTYNGRTGPFEVRLFAIQTSEPGLVRFRVVVFWMDDGAAFPATITNSDHAVEVQFLRTRSEVL